MKENNLQYKHSKIENQSELQMINDIHYLRQEIKVLTNFNDRLGKELSVCQLQVK
jgi:hypothetical protein